MAEMKKPYMPVITTEVHPTPHLNIGLVITAAANGWAMGRAYDHPEELLNFTFTLQRTEVLQLIDALQRDVQERPQSSH
ncbi:MAG: hypothetical protein Q7V20_23050 [Aquabacterium sp.]|uniref:hypothetical protein n=1 Tax=Aquabacterium sp. TaxID=1872578 RepID=UPI0027288CC8|nr:hypothetical protein [Aquabacterium sp.]MDO9006332.1 hypothetical protein [Aquabacterium sp.]